MLLTLPTICMQKWNCIYIPPSLLLLPFFSASWLLTLMMIELIHLLKSPLAEPPWYYSLTSRPAWHGLLSRVLKVERKRARLNKQINSAKKSQVSNSELISSNQLFYLLSICNRGEWKYSFLSTNLHPVSKFLRGVVCLFVCRWRILLMYVLQKRKVILHVLSGCIISFLKGSKKKKFLLLPGPLFHCPEAWYLPVWWTYILY